MKLGKFKTSILVFIYLFFTSFSFGEEKIVTVPLINLENLEPSFEEENRQEAIQRMNRCLNEFVIEGIDTTVELHKKLINHEKFINSNFDTNWLSKEKII